MLLPRRAVSLLIFRSIFMHGKLPTLKISYIQVFRARFWQKVSSGRPSVTHSDNLCGFTNQLPDDTDQLGILNGMEKAKLGKKGRADGLARIAQTAKMSTGGKVNKQLFVSETAGGSGLQKEHKGKKASVPEEGDMQASRYSCLNPGNFIEIV